jgi:hypothetical protein
MQTMDRLPDDVVRNVASYLKPCDTLRFGYASRNMKRVLYKELKDCNKLHMKVFNTIQNCMERIDSLSCNVQSVSSIKITFRVPPVSFIEIAYRDDIKYSITCRTQKSVHVFTCKDMSHVKNELIDALKRMLYFRTRELRSIMSDGLLKYNVNVHMSPIDYMLFHVRGNDMFINFALPNCFDQKVVYTSNNILTGQRLVQQ